MLQLQYIVSVSVHSLALFRYKHFRRDHSKGVNIAMHMVCLVAQLVGNFGVLRCLDQMVPEDALPYAGMNFPITTITAVLWSVALLLCGAPFRARICAIFAVAMAHRFVVPELVRLIDVSTVLHLFALHGEKVLTSVVCITFIPCVRPSKATSSICSASTPFQSCTSHHDGGKLDFY